MMSSQEFQELERKPVQEWTPAEREAYEADRDRQQRITETRRRVEAELRAKRAEEKRAQLWKWYSSIDLNESFQAQEKAAESKKTAAVRRQMALEAQITDLEAPLPSDD